MRFMAKVVLGAGVVMMALALTLIAARREKATAAWIRAFAADPLTGALTLYRLYEDPLRRVEAVIPGQDAPTGPQWTADGDWLYFFDRNGSLRRIGADGQEATPLPPANHAGRIYSIDPRQRRLVRPLFAANRYTFAVMPLQGDAPPTVFPTLEGTWFGDFAWTAAGDAVVFAAQTIANAGQTDIYMVQPATATLSQLTATPDMERQPAFTPDGTTVYFRQVAADTQTFTLLRVPAGGGAGRAVKSIANIWRNEGPVFSPDGRWMVVVALGNTPDPLYPVDAVIYRMRPDGSQMTRLSEGIHPRWSADGRTLFFLRRDSGRNVNFFYLARMDADGGNRRDIARAIRLGSFVIMPVADQAWAGAAWLLGGAFLAAVGLGAPLFGRRP